MLRALLTLLLFSAPLFAQLSSTDAKRLTNDVVVEMAFRDPKPPMAKLVLSPVETSEMNGSKLIRYSISVSGLPKSGPYILMTWDIGTDAPRVVLEHLTVDEKGTIRCGDKKNDCPDASPGSGLVVGVTGMIGQPRRFVLAGDDKKPVALGEIVPFPALGTDKQCSIEAVLLVPNAAATLILGRGFGREEAVKFTSSSPYGESIVSDKRADDLGNVKNVVLPFVKGHDEGKTSVALSSSKCRPNTVFNWGPYHEEQAQSPSQ